MDGDARELGAASFDFTGSANNTESESPVPRWSYAWTHNDIHDARVPVPQVTFDVRESHLGVPSVDNRFVDEGQRVSGWRTLVDTPSRD